MDNNFTTVYDIINYINDLTDIDSKLLFTEKSRSGYTSYAPNTTNSVKDKILKLILDNINQFKDYEIVQYNPIANIDGTVETLKTNNIKGFNELLKDFEAPIASTDSITPDKITFYTLCLNDTTSRNNVYLFRRTTKFKRLNSTGFFAQFYNNTLTEFDSKLIGIDSLVDIVVIEDNAFIFNHISIERIFKMNEQYNEVATKALSTLKSKNRITNFDEFEEDCLDDLRVQKMLAKLSAEDSLLENALNNFESIKETIDLFDLTLDIDRSDNVEKLVYNGHDKQNLLEILRIIRDVYYISTVNHRQGIDQTA